MNERLTRDCYFSIFLRNYNGVSNLRSTWRSHLNAPNACPYIHLSIVRKTHDTMVFFGLHLLDWTMIAFYFC